MFGYYYNSPQGTVKQTMQLTELEGMPISINVCGHYLVISTDNGYVKGWDISRRYSASRGLGTAARGLELGTTARGLGTAARGLGTAARGLGSSFSALLRRGLGQCRHVL